MICSEERKLSVAVGVNLLSFISFVSLDINVIMCFPLINNEDEHCTTIGSNSTDIWKDLSDILDIGDIRFGMLGGSFVIATLPIIAYNGFEMLRLTRGDLMGTEDSDYVSMG
jgi:hypothetical protein